MTAIASRKLNRTALISVAMIAALIGFVGFGIFDTAYQDRMSREALNRSFETRSQIQSLFSLLQDAETGQRGYVITGDPSYLAPYQQALDQLLRTTVRLRTLVDDTQRAQLDRVEDLSRSKLDELDRSIQVRRTEGLSAATDIVQSGVGKALMDDIRQVIGAMLSAEAERVQRDTAMDLERAVAMRWTMLGLLLTTVVVTGIAMILVSRHLGRRLAAELVLRRQERQVEALRSIAEACNLSTDFANAVGRTLAAFGEAVDAASGEAYHLQREKGSERIETLACWPPGSSAGDWANPALSPAATNPNPVPAILADADDAQAWRIVAPVRDEGRLVACLQWAGRGSDLDRASVEALVTYTVHQLNRVAERQRIGTPW